MAVEKISRTRIPISTYRVQFNHLFKFSDAKKIIPYLYELGISDIYASPYFRARAGSLHGYDIVNPNQFSLEMGTEADYNALINELHQYGMGQILDVVPNHMCITSKDNQWWMDVLENGPSSLYSNFFDIDWNPVKKELANKVSLPILGDQYGKVLENGELRLVFQAGAFFVKYGDHELPIRPQTYRYVLEYRLEELQKSLNGGSPHLAELLSIITALDHLPPYTEKDPEKIKERYREKDIIKKRLWNLCNESPEVGTFIVGNVTLFNGVKGRPESFDLLDRLLGEQVYRLSYWRVASEETNYRRFFDVNDLAAIRVEDPLVFNRIHGLVFKLILEGKITGLRVDHPDGLYNPSEYFRRLQYCCFELKSSEPPEKLGGDPTFFEISSGMKVKEPSVDSSSPEIQNKPFYIVGEKILARGERMPEDWPIYSTTGYVFLNSVNGIFVKTDHAKAFDGIYSRFIKTKMSYPEITYEEKKLVMQVALASEISTLGHYLDRISEMNRHSRDFTLNNLTAAIMEVIAFFPVYRTYINPSGIDDRDRKYVEITVSKAKRRNPAISESVFDFLEDVLLLNYPTDFGEDDRKEWLNFVMRFQQVTGPVMAKGVEDTAFYVYNRLVSLNEVGGSPDRFGTSLETFHGQNMERIKFWPHALIATSTHDSKRSEDVRARINVLSEIPDEWKSCLMHWSKFNRKKKPIVEGLAVPEPNEEYFFYQTLIGTWPFGSMSEPDDEIFRTRIKEYMIKAVREAKVNTSWINPNRPYEEALVSFIERILEPHENPFLTEFKRFQRKISAYGIFNALSQTLLKITSPGVPDFYQGTELWDFSLVDPDNRRPVDYGLRVKMLEELKQLVAKIPPAELARDLTISKESGMIKLYLIYKALNYRRKNRELFEKGGYLALRANGEKADHVCAFAREDENTTVIVVVPRFFTELMPEPYGFPFGEEVWGDTYIVLPFAKPGIQYSNIFTDGYLTAEDCLGSTVLYLSRIFSSFPVALLA
jgi:(1->4)-alpha-D-glucan 1-alpha-D-glucosylmutase